MAGKAVRFSVGAWDVRFVPAGAGLACRHRPSGVRLRGGLRFEVERDGKLATWQVTGPVDPVPNRLALVDPAGLCQGYLTVEADGDVLRLTAVQRALLQYTGSLRFEAAATVGLDSLACRTEPAAAGARVVQMASGPADSGLNESIFDVRRDIALQFGAAQVAIATDLDPRAGRRRFRVTLLARAHDSASAAIQLRVRRDYYRGRHVPWYKPLDRRRCPTAPTGWMSWNVYFDRAGEDENLAEARVAATHLKPYGLRIWSIESWQDNSDAQPVRKFANLTLRPYSPQFPHGMKWLADQIRQLGFVPGIWSVPFGTGDETFYRQHRDWFLHDRGGKPLGNWCGFFLVDPSQPAVRRYLEETYQVMARQWGYEFFKIDGMSAWTAHYSAHFYERPEVRAAFRRPCANPYELCVRAFRRGIGTGPVLLACAGAYSAPDVAVADAARIGHDVVGVNQPPHWHNYLNQVSTTLANLFTHGIVWYTDPDTVLVGGYAPVESARVAATVVALPGQLTFAGDKLAELAPDRMWLLQRCFPACDVRALDLFPIYENRPVWDLKVSRPFGAWDVVSLLNLDQAAPREMVCSLAELGLDPDREYLAYEFWDQRFLGVVRQQLAVQVRPKANALVALHPRLNRPQFLSSDRHLTQGAVEMRQLDWVPEQLLLCGCTELVAGETTALTFAVADGFRFVAAEAGHGAEAETAVAADGTLRLALRPADSGPVDWRLRFAAE